MRATFIIICMMLNVSVYAQELPLFATIPVSVDAQHTPPLSEKITFSYVSKNTELVVNTLQKIDNLHVQKNKSDIEVTLVRNLTLPGTPIEQHSKGSFVIDLDEESTQSFIKGFKQETHPQADTGILQNIQTYVHHYIEDPTYLHGFHIASKVATTKSGDCTEYAVLTTSLARHVNLPARYITGIVLLEESQRVHAYGHAWTEVWHDGHWKILDAALFGAKATQLFYLPIAELSNEGPGYMFSTVEAVNNFPAKIENVRNYFIK